MCESCGWQVVILRYLSNANLYCCFAFNGHWLKKECSRKRSPSAFHTDGRCIFSDCKITFDVSISFFNKPSDLTLTIKFSTATVCHSIYERKPRRISGKERAHLRESLSSQSPSTLRSKLFAKLNKSELSSGKRDAVGSSPKVLQKISSEGNVAKRTHFDLITSLVMLSNSMRSSSEGSKVAGYIQRIHAEPCSVTCYLEEGIRLYHTLAKNHCLFFDATGSVVSLKGTDYAKRTVYYYSLVLQHPNDSNSPVAVAEFISSEHNAVAISHFLECFRRDEYLVYGGNSNPKKIIIDRSPTLFTSFVRVFFHENVSEYLHRCFRIVMGCSTDRDLQKGVVLACVSHVMKSIKHHLKSNG